jgi:hypothetical protein
MIDNRKRCEYWFATLTKTGDELQLSVTDCNDKTAGSKNLGTVIFSASDQEKALLLYYAISDVIRNPYKAATPVSQATTVQQEILPPPDPGQHKSRYFFAPSSYNLEKGELYYNSLYFLLHDVQYGITDKFSMGMGTSIMGFPFYLTPKVTFPINQKSSFALGDMLIIGTYGTRFTGNLLYLTYSRGGRSGNFTVGGGFFTVGGRDIDDNVNAPVLNFSALGRISDHIYFITESYLSFTKERRTADHYDYVNYTDNIHESFYQSSFYMYNLIGFRFINKVKDVKCWQVGLSFITASFGEVPIQYSNSYYWMVDSPSGSNFIPVPVVGYARKFSAKY